MWPYVLPVLVAVALLIAFPLRQVTVFEFERGLLYRRGRFAKVLEPGSYWLPPRFRTITKVDVRPCYVAVPSQELATSDGATLKITLSAKYQVSDPNKAINTVAGYQGAVYTHLQLALRQIVAGESVDSMLAARSALGQRLQDIAAPPLAVFGVTLLESEIKDVMFPADLKRAFAQVVKARQEGLAALERARGETAALRHLANAAGMIEQRPALMQLRVLQTLGQSSGNTVVLGLGGQSGVIPLREPKASGAAPLPPSGEADA
jgi:regulator of protease activity HflC (stomatin/prohibitin superfamily)